MAAPADQQRPDTVQSAAVALVFTGALAMETVTMPLLALHAGYSKPAIGLLTALSAVTQLASRLGSAPLLRRIPDRTLVAGACALLGLSALMLAWSAAVMVFVAVELVQGMARGVFWTAIQSHLVRSRRRAAGMLAAATFVSGFGQLLGPLAAGVLAERSFALPLVVAAGVALVAATIAAFGLQRLALFARSRSEKAQPLWRDPEVRIGCWAGVAAGAWRGVMNSYIPVLLKGAGQTTAMVGVIVALGNGGSIVGSGAAGAVGERRRRPVVAACIAATGAGLAVAGYVAGAPVEVTAVLALSGLGAGILQTLSPTVAAMAVEADERGGAVALAGSFRAGALFFAPIGLAGVLGLTGLPGALAVAGALIVVPAIPAARRAVSSESLPDP